MQQGLITSAQCSKTLSQTFFFRLAGSCQCRDSFAGSDCSQPLSPPSSRPPRVSALANFGLCDVRTSPCRELVVLGDGLADHPGLGCVFEIYKIRGVATKQLVNDDVIASPAKFVSYQQVGQAIL